MTLQRGERERDIYIYIYIYEGQRCNFVEINLVEIYYILQR